MYLIPAPAKLEKKEGRFIWAYDRYVTVDRKLQPAGDPSGVPVL